MNKIFFLILTVFFIGCNSSNNLYIDKNNNVYKYGEFNLIQTIQTATDKLIAQAKLENSNTIAVLTTITDINNFQQTSQFGRTVSEIVAKSFIDKKIKVIDLRATNAIIIKPQNGSFYLNRNVKNLIKEAKANVIFFGTYSVSSKYVYITFKLINPSNHIILSAINLQIPLNNDIREMLGLKPLAHYYPKFD